MREEDEVMVVRNPHYNWGTAITSGGPVDPHIRRTAQETAGAFDHATLDLSSRAGSIPAVDRCVAGALAGGVRNGNVAVHCDPEVDEHQEEEKEQGQRQEELECRLAIFPFEGMAESATDLENHDCPSAAI
jgi:hypothetical protein